VVHDDRGRRVAELADERKDRDQRLRRRQAANVDVDAVVVDPASRLFSRAVPSSH
jgi:hypothetical protein